MPAYPGGHGPMVKTFEHARRILETSRVLGFAALVGSFLAVPAAASASTVSVRSHPESVLGNEILYVAEAGERNRVVFRQVEGFRSPNGGSWLISDAGATISTGNWCWTIDEHTAQCRTPFFQNAYDGTLLSGNPVTNYRASLGDLDDRLDVVPTTPPDDTLPPPTVVANGGLGNDVLFGGEAQGFGTGFVFVLGDRLRGGGGRDEIHGQGGSDYLSDGDRDGATKNAGPDRDIIDGGPGLDVVSYKQRNRPVSVDLARPGVDGSRGERDVIAGVEGVIGGSGDDRLIGDDGPNQLNGGAGRDRLVGRDGDDQLTLGGGSISCGQGNDVVLGGLGPASATLFEREYLQPSCETVAPPHRGPAWFTPLPAYPAFVRARTVGYKVRCPDAFDESDDERARCSGTVRFRDHSARRRLLARGRFADLDEVGIVRAQLTPLGRRLTARRRGVRSTMLLSGPQFEADLEWTVRLARRR